MKLSDSIIEVGPFDPGKGHGIRCTDAAALNELREELIAARKLREVLGQFRLDIDFWNDQAGVEHVPCGGWFGIELDDTLAELVQRADEHAEVCG